MKKFMQILLASFALMSLVFAGCNAITKSIDTSTVSTEGTVTEESTEPAAEATTEATTPAAEVTTEATTTTSTAQ